MQQNCVLCGTRWNIHIHIWMMFFFWFGLLCNEQRRDEKWRWFLNAQCVLNSSNTFLWRLDLKISHTLDTTDTKLDGRVAEKENLLLLFLSISSVRTASLFHRITWMHCSDDADNFFWHILNISPKVEVDLNCTLNQRLTVGALQLLYCSFFCMPFASVLNFFLFWIFLRTSADRNLFFRFYFGSTENPTRDK